MNIKTHFCYPPIPIRNYDWNATLDSFEPGGLIGYGSTEQEAIEDLKSQIEEEKDTNAPN